MIIKGNLTHIWPKTIFESQIITLLFSIIEQHGAFDCIYFKIFLI